MAGEMFDVEGADTFLVIHSDCNCVVWWWMDGEIRYRTLKKKKTNRRKFNGIHATEMTWWRIHDSIINSDIYLAYLNCLLIAGKQASMGIGKRGCKAFCKGKEKKKKKKSEQKSEFFLPFLSFS